jgi:putative two-component system response regulator
LRWRITCATEFVLQLLKRKSDRPEPVSELRTDRGNSPQAVPKFLDVSIFSCSPSLAMRDPQRSVLLVDDEARTIEVIGAVLERHGFGVTLARSSRDATELLERRNFDAVVSDVLFEGAADGLEVLRAARELQPTSVVVLMTGHPLLEGAVSAIKRGAFDYLQKPVDPVVLAAQLHRAIRERTWDHENLGFDELVEILSGMVANTIERIDPYTAGHGERTRRYCNLLAEKIGIDLHTRERLQLAAIAHDYGKIYLDDLTFLTKRGQLTAAEYLQVQRHPLLGAEKLGNHSRLREVCQWVAEHHERWDGTGYPYRRRGEEISLPGRVLCVVEVFDSLATKRSYKEAWGLQKVLDFFETQRELAFDPDVLDAFLGLLNQHGERWMAQPDLDRSRSEQQPARSIAV